MKIYSYRNFENLTCKRAFLPARTGLFLVGRGKFFGNSPFVFQLISICLLTVGLLLGFKILTDHAEVSALAAGSGEVEVRALSSLGRNLKSSNNLALKEIVSNNTQPALQVEQQPPTPQKRTVTYTVKAGDNLYAIALAYGVDFVDIAKDNNLSRPYNLQIGQQLYINY